MLDLRKAINTYIKSNISFSIILSPQNRILCNYIPCRWNIHIDKVLTKVRGHTRSEVEIRPCGGRYITKFTISPTTRSHCLVPELRPCQSSKTTWFISLIIQVYMI